MNLVARCILFRVAIAVLTRTFFQPDEFFQALEPAHRIVFGYGHLTWEWTAKAPIRSIAFPSIWVPVYWLLKVTRLHDTFLLTTLPKVVQGCIGALTDVAVCRLARVTLGDRYVPAVLFVSWTSFFHALALTRTLSNSIETSLTTLALSYWVVFVRRLEPSAGPPQAVLQMLFMAMVCASLACMMRITNLILWLFLGAHLLYTLRSGLRLAFRLIMLCVWIGYLGLLSMLLLDSLYYGRLTLTPVNFVLTNLSAVSSFYGTNPWHYYLSQALPIMCTTALPFVLLGVNRVARTPGPQRLLLGLAGWTIAVYSLMGHKEWRFIHPVLPILHVLAAKSLVDLDDAHAKRISPSAPPTPSPAAPALPTTPAIVISALHIRPQHRYLLLAAAPAALYVMLFHGSAQIAVMHHLRAARDVRSVAFLMPCHSTPWQSHLHRPDLDAHAWALSCEPPLLPSSKPHVDETTAFYADPAAFLRARLPARVAPAFPAGRRAWPSHVVMFGALLDEPGVRALLEGTGYREAWAVRNGWEEDPRRRGGVRVWRWDPAMQARFARA